MNFMSVTSSGTGLSSGPYIMPDSNYMLNNYTLLSVLSTWSAIKCRSQDSNQNVSDSKVCDLPSQGLKWCS